MWNKVVAPGKSRKINKNKAMFIPDSRVPLGTSWNGKNICITKIRFERYTTKQMMSTDQLIAASI